MTGTLNTSTDLKAKLLGLLILLSILSGKNRNFVYFYLPLVVMSRAKDTLTDLYVAMTWTLDTDPGLYWQ